MVHTPDQGEPQPYPPECVEGSFCELRLLKVLEVRMSRRTRSSNLAGWEVRSERTRGIFRNAGSHPLSVKVIHDEGKPAGDRGTVAETQLSEPEGRRRRSEERRG